MVLENDIVDIVLCTSSLEIEKNATQKLEMKESEHHMYVPLLVFYLNAQSNTNTKKQPLIFSKFSIFYSLL